MNCQGPSPGPTPATTSRRAPASPGSVGRPWAAASSCPQPSPASAASRCGSGLVRWIVAARTAEVDGEDHPELDARAVPHAIRHATVFGALDAVRPGGGLVLVAPHDPLPLLAQVEQRSPGVFEIDYLERGPEAWRLAFVRTGVEG